MQQSVEPTACYSLNSAWGILKSRQASIFEWSSSEDPDKGPVDEYHGTMNLPEVLREGIRGGSPKTRSRHYVPHRLRNADRISYTSTRPDLALRFARRRAERLGLDPQNVGVVGVRGRRLGRYVEHEEPASGDFEGTISRVRVGGIPRQYLVPVSPEEWEGGEE